ncbi:uncharacterized protein BP5553_07706 [Venustampulla echinocandica]|uniref:laccase n=1 Tax=Venustampulla echinocandica TaxID=2656787 RepID=A0A370THB0_9HELO|nr:uncharacterized protein BP5553_07706 [Venustampulla echinocandica]RDL34578.1 hypothetical protein BP5553_07706 [Venustampulla echinocandica]
MVEAGTLLLANLSQTATNGASLWGTFEAPKLPDFLGSNHKGGFPWSPYGPGSPPHLVTPHTRMTRYYEWTISRENIAPDGVDTSVILVNGQFPGPLIEADWGDEIQVTVHNQLSSPGEGTTVHWHGMTQQATPWMDGVPGVSQCPIAPGSTFVYKFTADQYGTTWYHSHYSAQYTGGLFGPMIIHGPTHVPYDIDIGPVMLNDWWHTNYFDVIAHDLFLPPSPVLVDNNLINGKMSFNCGLTNSTCTPNAGVSKFTFEPGKTHRLRLINAGSEGMQRFSIDNHKLTIIAIDFITVAPFESDVVSIGVGQRYDVLVNGTGHPGEAYWMRSNYSQKCASISNLQPNALAAVYYPETDHDSSPNSTANPYVETDCMNEPLNKTVPFIPILPPDAAATTKEMEMNLIQNATGHLVFTLGGSTFRANFNKPLLPLANLPGVVKTPNNGTSNETSIYAPDSNVYDFGKHSSIRLILTNPLTLAHPMHLHGHNVWVLAEGMGKWDGKVTNAKNPMRRDTFIINAGTPELPAYTVIEWVADNPGVWPFHCHVTAHTSLGFMAIMLERPDLIPKRQIPKELDHLCKSWDAWSNSNVVNTIDSGVKT